MQLASSGTARKINRDIVLELVRTQQPVSRADLARQSGLQRSTVSQIIEQLLAEQWVCDGRTAVSSRGRRPTLIRLNENLVALALDIHPRQATIAVVDLNGRLVLRSMAPLTSDPATSTQLILIAALSPSIIYIAGDVTSAWHRYGPVLDKAVRELTIAGTPPRVVASRDGDIARLRGAAALVFQGRNRA